MGDGLALALCRAYTVQKYPLDFLSFYGFLHGNCKRLIQRLHLLLRVCLPKPKEKPPLCCKHCGGVVTLTVIPYPRNRKPPDGAQATDREMPM